MQTTCYNFNRWVKKPLNHLLLRICCRCQNNNSGDIMSLVPENFSSCKYYDINFQNNNLNFSQNLFLLHLNIRSLQKNHDNLCELLELDQLPIKPHLIGLSEIKIKHQPLLDTYLPNYNFIHAASPTKSWGS